MEAGGEEQEAGRPARREAVWRGREAEGHLAVGVDSLLQAPRDPLS